MRIATTVFIIFGALTSGAVAAQVCPPQPIQLRVGVRESGTFSYCNANTIQSAINLASATCPTVINITREHTYTSQHLAVAGKNITFVGWGDGVTCFQLSQCAAQGCPPPPTTNPLLTISGSNTAGAVFTLTGDSHVTFKNLFITGGNNASDGGGISFQGSGDLTLDTTTVHNNRASYGGGINVKGSGGEARLMLLPYAQVLSNRAGTSGGGIRLEGSARLFALGPQLWLGYNEAEGGYGGGVEIIGPARADIASPGYNGVGVVSYNRAVDGGGVAALAGGENVTAALRLFSTDANQPVQVSSNSASSRGGALFLGGYQAVGGSDGRARACVFDYRINDNAAPDGAAIYLAADDDTFGNRTGSDLYLNTDPYGECSVPETPPALGAVACAAGAACNEIVGNATVDGNGQQVTGGATLLVDVDSKLIADRLQLRLNHATYLMRRLDDGTHHTVADLRNCLLADNFTASELLRVTGGEHNSLNVNHCTIAGNAIGSGPVLYVRDAGVGLLNSLIDQPQPTLDYVGSVAEKDIQYVLARDGSTLSGSSTVAQLNDAGFVDAANSNYRLRPDSPAVDYAPARGGSDLDRRTRTVDLPANGNGYGPLDLGAYEHPPIPDGTVFKDGFEN